MANQKRGPGRPPKTVKSTDEMKSEEPTREEPRSTTIIERSSAMEYVNEGPSEGIGAVVRAISPNDPEMKHGVASIMVRYSDRKDIPFGQYHGSFQMPYSNIGQLEDIVGGIVRERETGIYEQIRDLQKKIKEAEEAGGRRHAMQARMVKRLEYLNQSRVWAWRHVRTMRWSTEARVDNGLWPKKPNMQDELFLTYFANEEEVEKLNKTIQPMKVRPYDGKARMVLFDWRLIDA